MKNDDWLIFFVYYKATMEDWVKDLVNEFEKKENTDAVKLITEDGPEAVDSYGWSVMHLAVNTTNIPAFSLLLKHKVNIDNLAGGYQLTPLHMAVEVGSEYMVRKLIEARVDVNAVANGGQTPLHMAADEARLDIIELLVEAGAETDNLNVDGQTPLDLFKVCSIIAFRLLQ